MENRFTLRLNGKTIFESKKIKYLGIIMDDQLTWKFHIIELRKKLNRTIGMLFKMKNIAPLRVLHSLYYALFHSHLSYGICVWGNATNEALQPLGIAQNKIVRILSNADYDASTASLYSNLGILKVEDIFKHQIGSLMWDIENKNQRYAW